MLSKGAWHGKSVPPPCKGNKSLPRRAHGMSNGKNKRGIPMKYASLMNALDLIVDYQTIRGCAPVEISIGSTTESGIVQQGTLVIKDAPACIINTLIENGYSISVGKNGVIVDYYNI